MTTVTKKVFRISDSQKEVLLEGLEHKLSRSSMGWSYDDGSGRLRMHHPSTVKSLWKQGLLDANFTDPRGVGKCMDLRDVKNIDGARHVHSREVSELMVWTSALGRKALGDVGVLSELEGHLYN